MRRCVPYWTPQIAQLDHIVKELLRFKYKYKGLHPIGKNLGPEQSD